MNCINITKQNSKSCTLHNITEHDTKTEKNLAVKVRYGVTLSQSVETDQKCVAFYTINTAHILTV